MNSNIISIENYKQPSKSELKGNANLFIEMETLGIDPKPFLEIAALDLYNQYGSSAIEYSLRILQGFRDEVDFESTEIWLKILNILEELDRSKNSILH